MRAEARTNIGRVVALEIRPEEQFNGEHISASMSNRAGSSEVTLFLASPEALRELGMSLVEQSYKLESELASK